MDEIKKVDLSLFERGKTIGRGGYGEVFIVVNKKTNEKYAAKIARQPLRSKADKIGFKREVTILSKINHPAFVNFLGYSPFDFSNQNLPTIVTELVPNGSLSDMIMKSRSKKAPMEWNRTKKLINIYGIASGMAHLHKNNIIHRDLKPDNILLDKNYYPRITDFGFSKIFDAENQSLQSMNCGTIPFMAPEMFSENHYNSKVDVYAYAMLVYEMMTETIAFNEFRNMTMIASKVVQGYRPPFTSFFDNAYIELIQACWAQDPASRPSFDQIVESIDNNIQSFLVPGVNKKEFEEYRRMIKNSTNEKIKHKAISSYLSNEEINNLNLEDTRLVEEADQGNSTSCLEIGKKILNRETNLPFEVGIRYLMRAADENNTEALNYFGLLLLEGKVIKQDIETAKEAFQKGIHKGDTDSMVYLGLLFKAQEQYEKAANLFLKAANQGNPRGMLNYGHCLKTGLGVDKNYSEMIKYYKMAFSQNYAKGINAYAKCLELGLGTRKNERKAAVLYKEAAKMRLPEALRNYGTLYEDGRGVAQNFSKAIHYYNKAAEYGDTDAMVYLGLMHEFGKGVEIHYTTAARLYKEASKNGNVNGMIGYARLLEKSNGRKKDILRYYKLAAENGSEEGRKRYEGMLSE